MVLESIDKPQTSLLPCFPFSLSSWGRGPGRQQESFYLVPSLEPVNVEQKGEVKTLEHLKITRHPDSVPVTFH